MGAAEAGDPSDAAHFGAGEALAFWQRGSSGGGGVPAAGGAGVLQGLLCVADVFRPQFCPLVVVLRYLLR